MAFFKSLSKLASLYRFATFLTEASKDDVGQAIGYLLDLGVPREALAKITEHYIDAGDPANTPEEKQSALASLDALTDSILTQYADHELVSNIYKFLDVINDEAENEYKNSVQGHINESIEGAEDAVQYQAGQELAYSGGASVSEDIHKKRERDRQQQAYKRHNPITREEFLEKEREKFRRYIASEKGALMNKIKAMRWRDVQKMMQTGLSKEEAINKLNQELEENVRARIQAENISMDEAREQIKQIRDEELIKYYNNALKKGMTAAERNRLKRKRNKIRSLYLKELMSQNPDANPEELAEKVKAISPEEIDSLGERLLGAA